MADTFDAATMEGEAPAGHAGGVESPSSDLPGTQQETEPAAAGSQTESLDEPEAAELSQSPEAEQQAEAHEEPSAHDVQLPNDTESLDGLPPDHPLLARAQKALQQQLEAGQYRLESELREKTAELKVRSTVCLSLHAHNQVPRAQLKLQDYRPAWTHGPLQSSTALQCSWKLLAASEDRFCPSL